MAVWCEEKKCDKAYKVEYKIGDRIEHPSICNGVYREEKDNTVYDREAMPCEAGLLFLSLNKQTHSDGEKKCDDK